MQVSFSIVTPSYNQARFLRQNIQSVLEQDMPAVEHIVVDGGSTDGSVEILKEYPHLKWVSERDKGQSDALNKAMKMSSNEIIVWINSDDFIAPGCLRKIADFFSERPDATILCGNTVVVDERGTVVRHIGPRLDPYALRHPWKTDTSVFQQGVVFRRAVYERCGPIDAELHMAMDYDFFLRATEAYAVSYLPIDIGCFRVYAGTKTGDVLGPAYLEVKNALLRHLRATGHSRASRAWAALRLYLVQAHIWVCDAMRAEDAGCDRDALGLYVKAFLRNPLSLLYFPHILYRIRRLIGPERCASLRERFGKRGSHQKMRWRG